MEDYTTSGTHVVCDVYGVVGELTEQDMFDSAEIARMTVLCHAVTETCMALVLSESHLTIHHRYDIEGLMNYHIDVYTCGDTAKPAEAIKFLLSKLEYRYHSTLEFGRGDKDVYERNGLSSSVSDPSRGNTLDN